MKHNVDLLHKEFFELNGIKETLMDVSICVRCVHETENERLH